MLNMKYIGSEDNYAVKFRNISNSIAELKGDFPVKTTGFKLSRIGNPDVFTGDYSDYTTVYREIEGGVQFSNDGSVYVEPETIIPEPYVPTLEEVIEQKVSEMNMEQQQVIQSGIDVTLTDGTVEHFTLTDHDQTSLMGLQTMVFNGEEQIPWHTSDQSEPCKYYSNADMRLILSAAMNFIAYHVTMFRDLRIYIRSMETKEEVEAVFYGMEIPVEFQSEPLKDMLVANH